MLIAYRYKEICWNSLISLQNSVEIKNNIIGGDFNVILNKKEKRGGNILRDPFQERLKDLMND
jgi:hypothetical protein